MINFFTQLKSICGVRWGGSVSVPLKTAAGFTSLTDKSEMVIHWLQNFGILNLLLTFCRGQLREKKRNTDRDNSSASSSTMYRRNQKAVQSAQVTAHQTIKALPLAPLNYGAAEFIHGHKLWFLSVWEYDTSLVDYSGTIAGFLHKEKVTCQIENHQCRLLPILDKMLAKLLSFRL